MIGEWVTVDPCRNTLLPTIRHMAQIVALGDRLDPNYFCVYVLELRFSLFFFFFFFCSAAIVDFVNCEQCIRVLFTVPQITLFNNFFIKNGSHSTIYTFNNYFTTVFSVSIFSFSKNKLNPNKPYNSSQS